MIAGGQLSSARCNHKDKENFHGQGQGLEHTFDVNGSFVRVRNKNTTEYCISRKTPNAGKTKNDSHF